MGSRSRRRAGASRSQARRLRLGLASPVRNVLGGLAFVLVVSVVAVVAYVGQGWSVNDATYMAVLTVFTVGYEEVRPIDTPALRAITIGLIVSGCTGMIFVTGALIQSITATQFSELLDGRRMNNRIEKLTRHVIICGYGRIGNMIAQELHAAQAAFVILERSEARCAEATAAGYLCMRAEATEEEVLRRANIERARALATVLPDDAANVFITLSARSLNRELTIIARGEATSTERKLLQAGANRVVLPAHIGAERVAEMLLFPALAAEAEVQASERGLARLGLEIETFVAEPGSAWVGLTVAEIERRAEAAFLVVGLERAGTGVRAHAEDAMRIEAGDGVMVVGRSMRSAITGFAA